MWSDGIDLAALAAEHGTPLHVVRGDRLDANAAAAMAASEAADVFSSYKTNPVPGVLARLHGHGIGAEVISPYELWLAMRLGVPGRPAHLQRAGEVAGVDPRRHPPRRAAGQRQLGQRSAR